MRTRNESTDGVVVLGTPLPSSIESEALAFMKAGLPGLAIHAFTSKSLQIGLIFAMRHGGYPMPSKEANWARRTADHLIQREQKKGNIRKFGFGPATAWEWIGR